MNEKKQQLAECVVSLQEYYSTVPEKTDKEVYDRKPTSISLSLLSGNTDIALGETDTLVTTILPSISNVPELTYELSVDGVIELSESGEITPIAAGDVTISAVNAKEGKVAASLNLEVLNGREPGNSKV